jgi:AbrB family looped-hinge helix DNA binding protein
MLIAIDRYGSITLPASVRKEFGLEKESYLELSVEDGGFIVLQPVTVHRAVRLNEKGLGMIEEARKSGTAELPEWLIEDMRDARTDTEQEIS